MNEISETSIVIETTPHVLFVFTVAAINVLGVGNGSDITSEFVV